MRFDNRKLQADIEALRASGQLAAAVKLLRDRFLRTHKMDGPTVEIITAKDLQREQAKLRIADIKDQARLLAMAKRAWVRKGKPIDRENETDAQAAKRLLREWDKRDKKAAGK